VLIGTENLKRLAKNSGNHERMSLACESTEGHLKKKDRKRRKKWEILSNRRKERN